MRSPLTRMSRPSNGSTIAIQHVIFHIHRTMYCKPDLKYWTYRADLAVRLAEVPPEQVKLVAFNCGCGIGLAWVHLHDGTIISV